MDVEEGLDDVVLSDDEGAAVDVLVALPAEVVGPAPDAALHDFAVHSQSSSSASSSSDSSSSSAPSAVAAAEEPEPNYLADYYIWGLHHPLGPVC